MPLVPSPPFIFSPLSACDFYNRLFGQIYIECRANITRSLSVTLIDLHAIDNSLPKGIYDAKIDELVAPWYDNNFEFIKHAAKVAEILTEFEVDFIIGDIFHKTTNRAAYPLSCLHERLIHLGEHFNAAVDGLKLECEKLKSLKI